LGYTPNRAARSLVTGRTDTVALVLEQPVFDVFASPFYADVANEVHHQLAARDQQMVLVIAETDADVRRLVQHAQTGMFDGFITFVRNRLRMRVATALQAVAAPTVQVGRPDDGSHWVDFDHVEVATRAARSLLDKGCRRLGVVAGPE